MKCVLAVTATMLLELTRVANTAPAGLGTNCSTMAAITVGALPPSQFLLQADVPQWGTNESADFQVRLAVPGGQWQTCQPGTTCNGAVLPMLTRTELPDGSIHYSGYVQMSSAEISAGGQHYGVGTTSFVRLVTHYQMLGMCAAQASVAIPQGGSYVLSIHIPAGMAAQRIRTFWRPLDPIGYLDRNTSSWELCDDWNPPTIVNGQNVPGIICGGNQRSLQHVQFGYIPTIDPGDNAQVLGPIGCNDRGTGNPYYTVTNPQGCRVVIYYH
jgi:hypothetical protein